ncbi:MAG: N-acetylglucosamine-6-phosphate deacetylase [Oscillospiraceae bacterium]|nr:N-acetylglucosamine-6-phosphate deacetylase [Oscillospiraceae bacterium]
MIIKNGNLFCDDGEFRKYDIETNGEVISAIGESLSCDNLEIADAQDCYVIPGLLDIHSHGSMGADFCDGTSDAIEKIAKFQLKNGVTSFLGTTMSLPEGQLTDICTAAEPFVNKEYPDRAVLRGIHLEGPFFNQSKRGAQNPDYIINPDYDMFLRLIDASGETVRIIAVAPELDGGLDFIKFASLDCKISIGHSSADYETACSAYLGGANHATHLFNGMTPFSHREPGIIGAAFDYGVYVELIADGIHVHPSAVRAVFKLYGDDKVCLISDSMRACGLEDGSYDLGGQAVTVIGKEARVADGSLAGSVTPLTDCMRNAVSFGVPLASAIKSVTINPAKSVGLDNEIGSLTTGKRADILVLDKDLNLKQIIFGGNPIFIFCGP